MLGEFHLRGNAGNEAELTLCPLILWLLTLCSPCPAGMDEPEGLRPVELHTPRSSKPFKVLDELVGGAYSCHTFILPHGDIVVSLALIAITADGYSPRPVAKPPVRRAPIARHATSGAAEP